MLKLKKKREPISTEEGQGAPKKVEAPKQAGKSKAQSPSAIASKHHKGEKYQKAAALIEKNKFYSAKDALELLEKASYTKFDPTVEIHLNVTQKNMRGSVDLPHPIGEKKEKKYLIFTDKKGIEGKNIIVADDGTIEAIESGKIKPNRDFNAVIAGAKFMPQLARIAKVLGPAGMMPNPKNGTITEDPASVVEGTTTDAYEYRSDPMAPIIHTKLGKLSQKEEVKDNMKALVAAIGAAKIKKATLTSTMSPGIKIDTASL